MDPFVDIVLREDDPSTRYKLALAGLGGDGAARRASIRRSERVAALLSERGHEDCIAQHPYTRWTGAHWVLATPRRPRLSTGGHGAASPCATRFWSGCSTNLGGARRTTCTWHRF